MSGRFGRVTAIVPVRTTGDACEGIGIDTLIRLDLAQAFALDVLAALHDAQHIERIVVVRDRVQVVDVDPDGATLLVSDSVGRNAAVAVALDWLDGQYPQSAVLVVPSDLPCLTADMVDTVVERAFGSDRAAVPDLDDVGTTLEYAATADIARDALADDGWVEKGRLIDGMADGVRRDVDTGAHLLTAMKIGLGYETDAVVRDLAARAITMAVL